MADQIRIVTYKEVEQAFKKVKIDLLDKTAVYFGYWTKRKLVGIVAFQEYDHHLYLCHDFVLEPYRKQTVYTQLTNFRLKHIKDNHPKKKLIAFCTPASLATYHGVGFRVDNTLIKMVLEQ